MTMTEVKPTENSLAGGSLVCPHCQAPVRPGELICRNCNQALVGPIPSAATRALQKAEETFENGRPRIGSALHQRLQRVTLMIDGKQAPLPSGQKLIIGRLDPNVPASMPDIDLTPYKAIELGVSRQHIEITWKNDLIYVADVGSTNGTLLNGQRLIAGIERILRDHDVLMIGHMEVRVHFIDD